MTDTMTTGEIDELIISLQKVALAELFDRLYVGAGGHVPTIAVLNELAARFEAVSSIARMTREVLDVAFDGGRLLGQGVEQQLDRLKVHLET